MSTDSYASNRRLRLTVYGLPSDDYGITQLKGLWRFKISFGNVDVQQYYSRREDAVAARDAIVKAIIDTGTIANFPSWGPLSHLKSKKE